MKWISGKTTEQMMLEKQGMYDDTRLYKNDAEVKQKYCLQPPENILAPASNILPPFCPSVSLRLIQFHSILRPASFLHTRTKRLNARLLPLFTSVGRHPWSILLRGWDPAELHTTIH